jgi:hypothetical protein
VASFFGNFHAPRNREADFAEVKMPNRVKNPADLPEAIQRIAQQTTQERKDAFAWLEWKDARKNCWVNVGIFAAVIAAVFSVLSFFALFK